jgi:site-specific recombinase XerD
MKARRLAPSTQKTYFSEFKKYCEFFKIEEENIDVRYISRDEIIRYLAYIYDCGYSPSKVNQTINAIKFYKEQVLGQKRSTYFLKRPKHQKFIPTIQTPELMYNICMNTANLKHRAILFLFYDTGIRRGELLKLTLMDVRSKAENPHLIIKEAKHNSCRIVNMSEECVNLLNLYYSKYHPKHYLFEGDGQTGQYSATSIKNILDAACLREELGKPMRIHDLRHNYATHTMIAGTSMRDTQEQLGHKSYKTTEDYYLHILPEHRKIKRTYPKKEEIRLRIAN